MSDDVREQSTEPSSASGVFWRSPQFLIGGGIVVAVAICAGIFWWWHSRQYEETDDAFVDAHIVRVAPRIAGQLIHVFVHDNQRVQAGDRLAEIDPADVQAQLAQAQAQLEEATSALAQVKAQIAAAEATQQQAAANVDAASAEARRSRADLKRLQDLNRSTADIVTQSQLDAAVAAARSTVAQEVAAKKQRMAAGAQAAATRAQLATAQAKVDAARAQLEQAQLNVGYATINAPIDGYVSNKSAAVGTYVAPGQQILALVPVHLWVTANYKETQLADVRIGQSVDIEVDACPNVNLTGHVDSIQRGAGQAFDILPPQNATGNYVKVVQRVPVKIEIDKVPKGCTIGPGMSVVPSIRVR